MEIKRDLYLNRLITRRHNGMIKVVTGLRRCGKSYLLGTLFYKWLIGEGVSESNIIKIDLDSYKNRHLHRPEELYNYVESATAGKTDCYLLLDEIQLVEHFEEVLNGFLSMGNIDIYVTGNNARLLSKDVITEFRGRGSEIRMYPLSFSEYMSAYRGTREEALQEYLAYGSLPQIMLCVDEYEKEAFLKGIFTETYMRDIRDRYGIRHDADLEELVCVMASSVGSLTNPLKLSHTFNSVKKSAISYPTIKKYLEYLEDSFMIERSKRFDIRGRNYIDTPYKYYFADMGVCNAAINFSRIGVGYLMENLIYNELRVRGYNVDVGVVPVRRRDEGGKHLQTNLEVDFVCNKGNKRYYIQSAYEMRDEAKIQQELASLSHIDDSFKKIVVVGDPIPIKRDSKGIVVINIYDFLLKENSLEL